MSCNLLPVLVSTKQAIKSGADTIYLSVDYCDLHIHTLSCSMANIMFLLLILLLMVHLVVIHICCLGVLCQTEHRII